jgi:hypothetical protein
MRFVSVSAAMIATAAIAGCAQPSAPPTPAAAPALPPLAGNTQFFGAGVSATAGCPTLEWNLAPAGDVPGHYHGIVFFSDLSGIGYADGMVATDGKISGTIKSVYAKGPEGTIAGVRTANGIQVQVTGPGCSSANIVLPSSAIGEDTGRG